MILFIRKDMHTTFEEVNKKARIRPPSSLARHDKGFAALIEKSDNDAAI
jgi:hypothetical protein